MDTKKNMGYKAYGVLVLSILSMLLFGSIGSIEASTVASHDTGCSQPKEEFSMNDHVWAKVIMDNYVGTTSGSIWVCPCSWNEENMNSYAGCQLMVSGIVIPPGYEKNKCFDLGLASNMPNVTICKCYDVIFDAFGDGMCTTGGKDSSDSVGVINCNLTNNCQPNGNEAGFHIFPEASTMVLALIGVVLLFGYIGVRKRKCTVRGSAL